MDVAHLPAGGLEEGIAFVPAGGGQFDQRRNGLVDGIAQVRVGDVALDASYGEFAAGVPRRPFLIMSPVLCTAVGSPRCSSPAARPGRAAAPPPPWCRPPRAFLVAGDQEGDVQLDRAWRPEFFHGHHEGSDGGFMSLAPRPVEPAVPLGWRERIAVPLRQGAGGHHVGVPGKGYCFGILRFYARWPAAFGPQL